MFNFDNLGNKIKKTAKAIRIAGFTIIWLCGFFLLFFIIGFGLNGFSNSISLGMFLSVLIFSVIATFLIWISTMILYALGQFVENSENTALNTEIIAELLQKTKPINADIKEIPNISENN